MIILISNQKNRNKIKNDFVEAEKVEEELNFDEIRREASELWTALVGADEENANKYFYILSVDANGKILEELTYNAWLKSLKEVKKNG